MFGLTSVKLIEDKKELVVNLAKKVQTTKTGRSSKNIRRVKASDVCSSEFCPFSLIMSVFSKSAIGRRIRRQLFDLRRLLSLR